MNQALVEKIKKLLALANSPNENEAKLAAAKANELLIKHNLSAQQVNDSNFDYVSNEVSSGRYKVDFHQILIINILDKHYFVKGTVHHHRWQPGHRYRPKSLQLFGKKENVQVAGYVYSFLMQIYPKLFAEYKKRTGKDERARRSYYYGLTEGISHVLSQTRLHVETETGLVLVKDKKLEEEHKKIAKDGSQGPNTLEKDHDAFSEGVDDGLGVRIAKPIESKIESNGALLEAL